MGLLSSIGAAIFGGNKKDKKTVEKTNTQNDPWDVAIPYLTDYLGNTSSLYGSTPQISPYEQAGYDKLAATVNAGGKAIDPAIAANNKTLGGSYLDPNSNPYIKSIAQRAAGMAASNSNATFSGAGRTGSGLAGYYAGKGAADAANDVFYQNYSDERARQLEAAGQAPSLEAGRYLGPQAMISAGQNISSRPYDINAQYGNILATIAGLGGQSQGTDVAQGYHHTGGLIGKIADSFTNKLFPS